MTTPRTLIEQTTQGLRHFVHNLGEYPATMHFVTDDDMAALARASKILDRISQLRDAADAGLNTDWAFTSRLEDEELGEVVATNVENRKMVTGWWEIHDNLSFLATYLADHGESAATVAEMVETPWSWTEEFETAQSEAEAEILAEMESEQPAGFVQPVQPPKADNQRPT